MDPVGSQRVKGKVILAALEKHIKQEPAGVGVSEIRDILSQKYSITGSAQKRFVYGIPNVVLMDRLRFIHVDNLISDRDKLSPIVRHIDLLLERESVITARKVFDDLEPRCTKLGISSPIQLYSVLQILHSSDYDLPWYPQIMRRGVRKPGGRIGGVTSEIEDYIEGCARPCSRAELMAHFVDELRYRKEAVGRIAESSKVVRYAQDSVVHVSVLGWTDQLQESLISCALDYLHKCEREKRLHVSVEGLLERGDLPSLQGHLEWTVTLLEDFLQRSGRFVLSKAAGGTHYKAAQRVVSEPVPVPSPDSGTPPYEQALAGLSPRAILSLQAYGVKDLQEFLSISESRLRMVVGVTDEIAREILWVRDDLILKAKRSSRKATARREVRSDTTTSDSSAQIVEVNDLNHPECWSILTRPIGSGRQSAAFACIADLRLTEADMACLRGIAVFPEDSLSSLARLSLEVFAHSRISEEAFRAIQGSFSGSMELEPSDSPVVRSADIEGMEGWDLRAVGVSWSDADAMRRVGVRTLGDCCNYSESAIVAKVGAGIEGLRCVSLLWRLRCYARRAREGMPPDSYASFDHLIHHLTATLIFNVRAGAIFRRHTGLHDGTPATFQEIGKALGIGQQRIRHIYQKCTEEMNSPPCRKRIQLIFRVIRAVLEDYGVECTGDDLAMGLARYFGWSSVPDGNRVMALARLSLLFAVREDPPRISLAGASPKPKHDSSERSPAPSKEKTANAETSQRPKKAVRWVQHDALHYLKRGAPFVSVEKLFSTYRRDLARHLITSAHELYAHLSALGGELLAYPGYPRIVLRQPELEPSQLSEPPEETVHGDPVDDPADARPDWIADLEAHKPPAVDACRCKTLSGFDALLHRTMKESGARFIGRIEMPRKQVKALIDLLARQLRVKPNIRDCAQHLVRDHPCAVAYAMVQLAAEEYSNGGFWRGASVRLGVGNRATLVPLSQSIEICKKRYSLSGLAHEYAQRYVTPVLMQVGIPDLCIPGFAEFVMTEYLQSGLVTPHDVLRRFREDRQSRRWRGPGYQLDDSVADFLEHGDDWAEQWVVVTAAFLGSPLGLPPELSNIAPRRLIRALEHWAVPMLQQSEQEEEKPEAESVSAVPEAPPSLPEEPKPRRPKCRRARVQTRLDSVGKSLVVAVGDQKLVGEFLSECHVQAVLRDGSGHEVKKLTLDASRADGGAVVRGFEVDLPVVEGEFRVDIEYAGEIIRSYPVENLLADEPCLLFSGSGTLTRDSIPDAEGVSLLLRHGAAVSPECALRSRELLADGQPYDLGLVDVNACLQDGLSVEWNGMRRAYQVRKRQASRGITLHGGDRVPGVYSNGYPVYGYHMPRAQLGQGLDQLHLEVRMIETDEVKTENLAHSCSGLLDSDGFMDIRSALSLMEVPDESAVVVSLHWVDPGNKPRSIRAMRVPGLFTDFSRRVYVPQRDNSAKARVTLPSGWRFKAGVGTKVLSSDGDAVEVELDLGQASASACLERGGVEIRLEILAPTVQWRLEGRSGTGEQTWRSAPEALWVDRIGDSQYERLAVRIASEDRLKVALEPLPLSRAQWCSQETSEIRFSLHELVQTVLSNPPVTHLRLVLIDAGAKQIPPIDVTSVFTEWVPFDTMATVSGPDSQQQIELAWSSTVPRQSAAVSLRPAWLNSSGAYTSTVRAGDHSCTFDVGTAVCGPHLVGITDEDEEGWGAPPESHREILVWVCDGCPQVREFRLERKGRFLKCSGSIYSPDEHQDLAAVVLRNRAGCRVDTLPVANHENGRFEFVVDDPMEDAGIVGVVSSSSEAHRGLYRFEAVAQGPGCCDVLSGCAADNWLELLERFPDSVRMWIGGCDLRPIQIPSVAGKRILQGLARGAKTLRLSLTDAHYHGQVNITALDDSDVEFEFSFESDLVKCVDANCVRSGEIVSKEKWDHEHGPRCKSFEHQGYRVRANLAVQLVPSSMVANPFAATVADSCFRTLSCNPASVLGLPELASVLIQALRSLWRPTEVERTI